MSEQLSKKNVELDSKTEQLDRKCQQLEDASKLKSGILFHIMCFAVSGRIFFVSYLLCLQSKMQNSTDFAKPSSKSDKRKRKSRSEQLNWPKN